MSTSNQAAEALLHGNFEEARMLLNAGAPLSGPFVDNNKQQIISNIFRQKAFDLVDILVKNGLLETDVYELDRFDNSIFYHIARNLSADEASVGFLQDFLPRISNHNDEVQDQTALGYCLDNAADPKLVQCLIDAGFDVQYKNNAENGLLHQVIRKNMLPEEKGIAYLHLLISSGMDVNDKNIVGETPLIAAVKNRKTDYLEVLLQNGANPNEQDKQGNTPFYYAVAEQFNAEAFTVLSQYATPDWESRNRDGDTVLCAFMRMMQGSDGDIKLFTLLLENGAELTQTSPYYGAPKSGLHWLAEKPAAVLQQVLALHSADMHYQDENGDTLLHKVCAYNVNYDANAAKEIYRKVKMLLDAGADPAATNNKDETPLMLAQQDNLKVKTVALLMGS